MVITLLSLIVILLLILLAKRDGYLDSGMRGLKQKQQKKSAGRIHVTQIKAIDADIGFSSLGLIKSTKAGAILEFPGATPGCRTRFLHGTIEFRFIENFDDAAFSNAEDIGTLGINNEHFNGSILCSKGLHEHLIALKDANSSFSMDFSALFYRVFLFNSAKRANQPFELRIAEIESIKVMEQAQLKTLMRSIGGAMADSAKIDWPESSRLAASKP